MIIAFNKALVRVNSNNILPIEFLADELPILQGIWGSENIQDVTPIGTRDVTVETELPRLFMKYPTEKVEDIYQKNGLLLGQMLPTFAVEADKTAKAAKTAAK